MATKDNFAGDVVTVANFIAFHEDGDLWGGYRKEEAFMAFCRLVDLDEEKMKQICEGTYSRD